MSMLIRHARVLTLDHGPRPRRGTSLADLAPIEDADVLIRDGRIERIIRPVALGQDEPSPGDLAPECTVINAEGRVLMPAFVDCHTHACWAGSRLDEWEDKRRGVPYLDLLRAGGGIMSTVRSVRGASRDELAALLLERLRHMLREGTTTVEVKSGYGLATEHELKMLHAIRDAAGQWPGTVVPTACLGHAVDASDGDRAGHERFVSATIEETLGAVHEEFPGITIDAYCEHGAWSRDDCIRLFERAHELGHPIRVHADQFSSLGMIPAAIHLGAHSVDHLEASRHNELVALAESGTYAVMLPCSGFHVDARYADGRAFVDAGGALCIATNCNPGSAPCQSMPMAVALAVRHLGLTPAEAIVACTANAASLLGLNDRGVVRPGARADLVLLRHRDERHLAHDFGGNPVDLCLCAGALLP